MRDLLPDNIALVEQLEAQPSHRSSAMVPEAKEVGTLATWFMVFSIYVYCNCSSSSSKPSQRHASIFEITGWEAQKYKGTGWS